MNEIVNRLTENRQIERAKQILESNGYKVSKKLKESSDLFSEVSEYGTPASEILDHTEDYFTRDAYMEDDIYPPDGIRKAIENYMKTSPSQVMIVDGEGEIPWDLFSQLRTEFKKVPGGETFYQGMGTGEGVEYGTIGGEKVLLWWVGGANGAFLIPKNNIRESRRVRGSKRLKESSDSSIRLVDIVKQYGENISNWSDGEPVGQMKEVVSGLLGAPVDRIMCLDTERAYDTPLQDIAEDDDERIDSLLRNLFEDSGFRLVREYEGDDFDGNSYALYQSGNTKIVYSEPMMFGGAEAYFVVK